MGNNAEDRSASPASSNSSGSDNDDWVQKALKAQETRTQPWKKTFGNTVDNRFDAGKDIIKIENDENAEIAFRVLSNSVAA